MPIIKIEDISDSRVDMYRGMTERQLRNDGVIVVESPKVITTALDCGLRPLSLLCEERHITGDAREIIARMPDIDIFTGSRDILASLTGYVLTRGVLCAMVRPEAPSLEATAGKARRVAVIDSVCDTTNIGAIFRSAAALGVEAVLLTPSSCDPFNRRSIRVSMGTVFRVPWTWIENPVTDCKKLGLTTLALALSDNSLSLDDTRLKELDRIAMIFGTEGDGLSSRIVEGADYVVKIPMELGVDSLNVAAASAVTFWQLCR